MSEEREFSEEVEEGLSDLISVEDEITEYSEEVKEIFNENLEEMERFYRRDRVIGGIADILMIAFQEQETARKYANLLSWIITFEENVASILRERGASDEFIRLIAILRSRHANSVEELQKSYSEGESHWKRVQSDWITRGGSGTPGINHQFILGGGDTFELTTSLHSNLDLANLLLSKQINATEYFGEESSGQVSPALIERLEENVEILKEMYGMGETQESEDE